jgi:gluconolactonase
MKWYYLLLIYSFIIHAGKSESGVGTNFGTHMMFASAQAEDSLIEKGATLQTVSKDFKFTEGPAVDKKGNVFFTDQPNDKIWKYDTKGKLSIFLEKTGRSNGMHFDRKGNLLACADEKNELWSISPRKKITVLVKDLNGLRLNGPNDLWVDLNGGIYFTDPYYQRAYWQHKAPDIKEQNVYFLAKGKTQPVAVTNDLLQPNGIVGTPDGKYLYVSDIKDRKTYRYAINKDGSLSGKHLLIEQGSDGMTLDHKGNIYLTGNGVMIYDQTGARIGKIEIPSKWTANVCFAGKDRKLLFITASEAVYTLRMQVHGVE